MSLKNDSSPQYLAVHAYYFTLLSPLYPASEERRKIYYESMVTAVSCGDECARNPLHSPHTIAGDCQASEDDTVSKAK